MNLFLNDFAVSTFNINTKIKTIKYFKINRIY